MIQTTKPEGCVSLNGEALWWSKSKDVVYRFGGEVSNANGSSSADANVRIATVPPESIWQFKPDGNGSGSWLEALGPTGEVPYPSGFIATAYGASIGADDKGYYIAGYASAFTTPTFSDLPISREEPGIQTFDFNTSSLTNSSDGGFFASQYRSDSLLFDPGKMIFAPSFGLEGILLLLGGTGCSWVPWGGYCESGVGSFNNITIYDLHTQTWYWQAATAFAGQVPSPRGSFCAVGVQGGDNSTYEM